MNLKTHQLPSDTYWRWNFPHLTTLQKALPAVQQARQILTQTKVKKNIPFVRYALSIACLFLGTPCFWALKTFSAVLDPFGFLFYWFGLCIFSIALAMMGFVFLTIAYSVFCALFRRPTYRTPTFQTLLSDILFPFCLSLCAFVNACLQCNTSSVKNHAWLGEAHLLVIASLVLFPLLTLAIKPCLALWFNKRADA